MPAAAHLKGMQQTVDLATRHSCSIDVALIYDRLEGTLAVFVRDSLTGEEFLLPVNGDEAAEVYRHPYAYAHRGLPLPDESERASLQAPA
jgi:hypothetical protein